MGQWAQPRTKDHVGVILCVGDFSIDLKIEICRVLFFLMSMFDEHAGKRIVEIPWFFLAIQFAHVLHWAQKRFAYPPKGKRNQSPACSPCLMAVARPVLGVSTEAFSEPLTGDVVPHNLCSMASTPPHPIPKLVN